MSYHDEINRFLYGASAMPAPAPRPVATSPFLVWNPDGTAPRFKHSTRYQAEVEARRLADANPGKTFYVMGALSISSAPKVAASTRALV